MENRAQDHLQLEPKIIYRYEICRMWVKNFPSAHYHQCQWNFPTFSTTFLFSLLKVCLLFVLVNLILLLYFQRFQDPYFQALNIIALFFSAVFFFPAWVSQAMLKLETVQPYIWTTQIFSTLCLLSSLSVPVSSSCSMAIFSPHYFY